MAVIWGSNYAIVKSALGEVPAIAYNAVRLTVASIIFLIVLARSQPPIPTEPTRSGFFNNPRLWALALVGHTIYQLLFIVGLANTSASNSALVLGCTPVFVALMSFALGHERIPAVRWAGIVLSLAGMYLVVGRGPVVEGDSLRGDLLMLGAVVCWSASTIISRSLLLREPPLRVTGYSMAIGTLFYLPAAWPQVSAVDWAHVSLRAWMAMMYSAVLALCVAYMIWYTAVQRLGNARTAIYSNLVPVTAMLVAVLFYGEPVGPMKLAGAAAILAGVGLTRL